MARFEPGVPVRTAEPSIEVEAGLDPGRHRFQLLVFAADGRASAPVEAIIEIARGTVVDPDPVPRRPTPR